MTDTIEYIYTTYLTPVTKAAYVETSSGETSLANSIAQKVFDATTGVAGNLWSITQGITPNTKTYICGFVRKETTDSQTQQPKIDEMYFVCVVCESKTVSGETKTVASQVNCYKCNTGHVADATFDMNGIKEGGKFLFGVDNNSFHIPPHSFFLEGDHQAFNDLPAGTYEATLLV